jgi:hypothetical protein
VALAKVSVLPIADNCILDAFEDDNLSVFFLRLAQYIASVVDQDADAEPPGFGES